ncbi:PREDICTED: proteasome activator complex subunit 4-like isoform X2 [Nicrophorus vespilloides]|nr:PREDICTED: proteasome activator complex subunit 4-like isoform X2 [Nicrophorus vespilloides]
MYRYMTTLQGSLDLLVKSARIYFPVTATQEVLDEFRPKLCPLTIFDMQNGINYLEAFLPIITKPEEAHLGYKLWLEEFMNIWNVFFGSAGWENDMTWLMANLAYYNVGQIDWDPYIPNMFVRFMRTLGLPVTFKHKGVGKFFKVEITPMAMWIVYTLGGPTDLAFKHLEQFMHTLESYYHTANSGRWSPRIKEFLKKISLQFVTRIHNERHKAKSWEFDIPDSYKLSDYDIDRFVNIMKPCVEHSVFSRQLQDLTMTYNYLASLRPNIIVPILLDKLYMSMDSLTEPNKLTSAMNSVTAVARYMVQGKRLNYPEGPMHVIPLLFNLLPGIDPNDIRKCFMTFNFIVQFVNMIPLLNSSEASKYYTDLTEEEHIVCEATAGFEDFVLQFFDRLCIWVESNSLESTRMEQNDHDRRKNKSETVTESALISVLSAVLSQCSPEIFTSALRKMYNFATTRIFEVKISGKLVGIICQIFARINPQETTKLFIPHLCDTIENLFSEHDNIMEEENLDEELLYNILLLSEIVDVNSEIIKYIDRITQILDRLLFMASLQATVMGGRMLSIITTTLTFTQPKEYRSTSVPYDTSVKDYLPIREWGKAGQLKDLNISWYMPGEKEIECAQMLLNRYLIPELEKLEKYADGELELNREERRKSFKIVVASLGCHTVLPLWKEPPLKIMESVLKPWAFELIISSSHTIQMPDGRNVRKVVADILHKVQIKILDVDEGDTKSIFYIINIYDLLLFNKFRGRDFEYHWKNFHTVKILLEDKVNKRKKHLRHILIDRVMLHQELRNESRSCMFTYTHQQVIEDLFKLATSRYSEVRILSQLRLFNAVHTYPYAYTVISPYIKEILTLDSTEHHSKFKGCLYILLGPKSSPIIARHDWQFIKEIWPMIVTSKPSEKISIVNLMDSVVSYVHTYFPTIAINFEIPEKTLKVAYDFAEAGTKKICLDDFTEEIQSSSEKLRLRSLDNLNTYNEILDMLLEAATTGNLHWRYHMMAVCFLRDLVHCHVRYNANVVRFFLSMLINESLKIRKLAMKAVVFILIQNKPNFVRIQIDPKKYMREIPKSSKLPPGIRADNEWLLYNSKTSPKNTEQWNETRFCHDQYSGYYCWPPTITVSAPPNDQPNISDHPEIMTAQQKEIYEFFTNDANMDLLIKYWSLEEKKGNDKFSSSRFILFKHVFKMFEDKLLPIFIPRLQKLTEEKQEQSQRCATEIISGLLSGCKHWNYEKTENMWKQLLPIIRTAFNNLSDENFVDWASCFAAGLENRDPNRYYWLLEFLVDSPLSEQTTFIASARLYIIFVTLAKQSWRNAELLNRNFEYLKDYLSHPFQNIRDKINISLVATFLKDFQFPSGDCPKITEFFETVTPKLNELYANTLYKLEHTKTAETDAAKKEVTDKIRLFKVVGKFAIGTIARINYSTLPEFVSLIPIACVLQSNEVDDELSLICNSILATFSNNMTLYKNIPNIISCIKDVSVCPFWSARAVIAEFIGVFVFHNMANIIMNKKWIDDIQEVAIKLLQDLQPEVRVKAGQLVSGLLHCHFVRDQSALLEIFKDKAATKLRHRQGVASNICVRHAGVLGLCSFINAHPYDVPDYIPGIFEDLGAHLSDPQPIPATIRKTLGDFKRTHHVDWEYHKLKFTESELLVLSDLTVPPSYYA